MLKQIKEFLNYNIKYNERFLTIENVKKICRKFVKEYIKGVTEAYNTNTDCSLADFSTMDIITKEKMYRAILDLENCDPDIIKISSDKLSAKIQYTQCSYSKLVGKSVKTEIKLEKIATLLK